MRSNNEEARFRAPPYQDFIQIKYEKRLQFIRGIIKIQSQNDHPVFVFLLSFLTDLFDFSEFIFNDVALNFIGVLVMAIVHAD